VGNAQEQEGSQWESTQSHPVNVLLCIVPIDGPKSFKRTEAATVTFQKGNSRRPEGSKNKTTKAIALQIAATRKPPLEAMLDVMDCYYRRWKRAEEDTDRTRAAEMTLRAATLAAPYVHARKLIVEEDVPIAVNIIDRREMGRVITVNGNGSNGSNGHGPIGHGSNGHGANGNGSATDLN
jgi:hypothetical protein